MLESLGLGRAGGVAALAAVAAAGAIGYLFLVPGAPRDIGPSSGGAPAPSSVTTEDGSASGTPDTAPDAPPGPEDRAETAGPSGADAASAKPALPPPRFDIVRVDPQGNALVAGTAPAGHEVSVEVDGAEIARATADDSGNFAALFDMPLSGEAQVVFLVARGAGGAVARSEDSVILAPRATTAGGASDAVVASGSSSDETQTQVEAGGEVTAAARPAPGQDGLAPDLPPPDAPLVGRQAGTGAAGAGAAPTILLARDRGVEVLQPPAIGAAGPGDRVVVDVISYAEGGAVSLEGRAAGQSPDADRVRIYLDNRAVQTVGVAEDGSWKLQLSAVDPGLYTLRVDQVDAADKVAARFETPFKREDPAALAGRAAAGSEDGEVSAAVITVQPGYTLWGIASDRYGNGLEYVQIFEANKALIRNPDLIYPGQVFDLPTGGPGEAAGR